MALIPQKKLEGLLLECSKLSGEFMEIGVFKGHTFKRITPLAKRYRKKAFALDSFCGMDEATDRDGPAYPKGRLSCGGLDKFHAIMASAGYTKSDYECFEGYIPTCFSKFDSAYPSTDISFVLIDVDQYKPTMEALEWVWPKIPSGGILALDDYFDRTTYAAGAINDWLSRFSSKVDELSNHNTQLFLQKK